MCDYSPNREAAMVVIDPGTPERQGRDGIWCDPCLVPIVKALNDGGLPTVASCCGHGKRPGNIALADGRELVLMPDYEAARALDDHFHNLATEPDNRAEALPPWVNDSPEFRLALAEERRTVDESEAARPTSIRIPADYDTDPETGLNRGRAHGDVPIEYDPNLPTLGERHVHPYGPCPIVLREWNEQVLLHELLHLLLDGSVPRTEADPHGHRTIARVEVALWESGWRFMPTPAVAVDEGTDWFREQHERAKERNAQVPPHARMVVTNPELSTHHRPAAVTEGTDVEALAEALLLAMDGDFLPGAGMSVGNVGEDVPLGEARPKEVAHWAARVLAERAATQGGA